MVRAAVIIGAIALAGVAWRLAPQAEKARVVPPPSVDAAAGEATSEVAVLAGGCFWGVQGVFQHVKGVTGAVSGYAGGQKSTADYETVGGGESGHAESVKVTFDPVPRQVIGWDPVVGQTRRRSALVQGGSERYHGISRQN